MKKFLPLIFIILVLGLVTIPFIYEYYKSPTEHDRLLYLVVFSFGYLIQFIFPIVRNKQIKWTDLIWAMIPSVFMAGTGFLSTNGEYYYNVYLNTAIVLLLTGCIFSTWIHKYISPKINEQTFLLYCVLLGYLMLITGVTPIIWIVFTLIFLLSIINIYTNIDINKYIRASFYVIFLAMVIGIYAMHLRISDMDFFFGSNFNTNLNIIDVLASGMLIGYIIPYATYLLKLSPIPGKYESWEERKQILKLAIDEFAEYFNPHHNLPIKHTLMILCVIVFLYLNYKFGFVSESYVILLVFIIAKIGDMFSRQHIPTPDLESKPR